MRLGFVTSAAALVFAASALAQTPSIRSGNDAVVNNASYLPAGLPNGSIAQGSIFAIFGDNLGPASIEQQPAYPLQKTLAGTSVKVTVGGTTVDAIPIYTTKTQVGAVLPSNTPTGSGQVTVTYNNQTSASHAITVVPSSFGIFTLNQQGSGPAVITDANYNVITLTNSAKPNQTIIIWGTGLGGVTGDETASPKPADLTNIPVRVTIGDQTAPLVYRGRSGCCSGLDQVMVTVPNVSGCYESLIVRINDVVSNVTTIPVAANGGACSDPNGFSATDLTNWIKKGSVSFGYVGVGQSTTSSPGISVGGITLPGQTTTSDDATAMFVKYDATQLVSSQGLFRQASIGSCIVNTYSGASGQRVDPVRPTYLDAGAITLTPPSGSAITLNRDAQFGFYSVPTNGNGQSAPFFGNGGQFKFAGAGGPTVGSFNTDVTITNPLKWTNMDAITDVTRGNGQLITWSGGADGTYVVISGSSMYLQGSNASNAVVVSFSCTARADAHQFMIPAEVLYALPPSSSSVGGVSIPTGSLSVSNDTNPKSFSATGLDVAYTYGYVSAGKSVNYK